MHSTGRAAKNVVLYSLATMAQKAISFVSFWVVSSHLSPHALGTYFWVLSVMSLFAIGTDLGITPFLTREAAQHPEKRNDAFVTVVWIKFFFACITVGIFWLLGTRDFLFGTNPLAIQLMIGATVILLCDAFLAACFALLRSAQLVNIESRSILVFQVVVFVGSVGGILLFPDPRTVMAALALGSVVNFCFTGWQTHRAFGPFLFTRPSFDRVHFFLSRLLSFGSAGVFVKIYQQADVFLLGFLKQDPTAIGLYAIPAKVTTALQTLIPGMIATSIYPTMANFAKEDRVKAQAVWNASFRLLLLITLPLAVLLGILAEGIVVVVWPQYRDAVLPMRLMFFALPAVFFPYLSGATLNAFGYEKKVAWNRGLMTAVSVISNILLIPPLGVMGAAISFACANALLLVADFWQLHAHDSVQVFSASVRTTIVAALVSMGAMAIISQLFLMMIPIPHARLHGAALLCGISLISSAISFFVLLLMRGVTKQDLYLLRELLQQKIV